MSSDKTRFTYTFGYHRVDFIITKDIETEENIVEWTCPKCGYRYDEYQYFLDDHDPTDPVDSAVRHARSSIEKHYKVKHSYKGLGGPSPYTTFSKRYV